MLEIETKYPAPDFARLEVRLNEMGAKLAEEHTEADHYFNAPDRDFAQTDEAFRLRRIGAQNLLTYKGPRAAGPTKTRLEIEVPVGDGDGPAGDMIRLVEQLHYRPVAVVRKQRRSYELQRDGFDLHVSLDDVEGVGRYAEVEIVAEETRSDAAKQVVLKIADELGLVNSERRSYLQLLLERN
jgi:adenylate cyclase class 2